MERKESKGKGTFKVTKSGSLEYRLPYYDEDNIRRTKSFTAKTKEECLQRADEFIKKTESKSLRILPDATIPDIMEQKVYNDYMKNYTGEQGYDRNLYILRTIRAGSIGNIPIADITEEQLNQYFSEITRYSGTIIRRIYSFISTAFKMASDKGVVQMNLIVRKDIRCPKSQKADKNVRGMTEGEQKKFVEALMKHKVPYGRNTYKIQLLLELYTGMRMGEINALKPENINFKDGYIHVGATISRGLKSKSFYKPHPKTAAGIRDVPITEKTKELLMQALEEMKDNPEGLIFYDYNKEDVVATYQVGKFFERICVKADVPYYGQHALRHTFATRCIEAGVPAVVLKKWLGHTDINITLDTYADVFERLNHTSVERFELMMDEIMK